MSRKKIFLEATDRKDFITRLAELAEDDSMDIYAWSLLPNHFHLLTKTKKRPLSSSMRKLLTGYVVNFNKRHGHLFQNRYKSIVCQEGAYLMELVRYIHLNLIRTSLVKDVRELNRSPWSGHSVLMGYVKREWQNTEYILSFFGKGRFGVLSEMNDLGKENLRLKSEKMELPSLAEKVCEIHQVSLGELRSGSRRKEIVEARRVFSWLAVKELGYSGAEVARYLGVTTSCVTRTISLGKEPERENYIK